MVCRSAVHDFRIAFLTSRCKTVFTSLSGSGLFGNGQDGPLHYDGVSTVLGVAPVSGTYTLTRDIWPSTMIVDLGVTVTGPYRIIGSVSLELDGVIQRNGNDGSPASPGPGTGGAALVAGSLPASSSAGTRMLPRKPAPPVHKILMPRSPASASPALLRRLSLFAGLNRRARCRGTCRGGGCRRRTVFADIAIASRRDGTGSCRQ